MMRWIAAGPAWGGLAALVLLAGCAAPLQSDRLGAAPPAHLASAVEWDEVPFFPQTEYHCGPAALATVLGAAGAPVSPEGLAPQVYVPERQGSLQIELLAAARRQGYVPYVLAPRLETLLAEVQAGHPVLVLQNLALDWYPRWHYAVAVGFDLPNSRIVLRSGTDRRRVTDLARFERTWRRGGYWAMVALPPDRLPASAEELPYLRAAVGLEQVKDWPGAQTAYRTALTHWPHSVGARMGLGNSAYALGNHEDAEQAFRTVIEQVPEFAPAHNNLALALAARGRLSEAVRHAERAVALGGPYLTDYEATLRDLQARLPGATPDS